MPDKGPAEEEGSGREAVCHVVGDGKIEGSALHDAGKRDRRREKKSWCTLKGSPLHLPSIRE